MRHLFAILGMVTATTLLTSRPSAGQITPMQAGQATAVNLAGPEVHLGCTLVASQSVHKALVKNTLAAAIPMGTLLRLRFVPGHPPGYYAPNAPTPSPKVLEGRLSSAMSPGQSFEWVLGWADQWKGCSVWFHGGLPDLQLVEFRRTQGQATLTIRNNNPFVDAGPFVARIKAMKCSQIELARVNFNVSGVPKGQTTAVGRAVPLPAGFQYFDASVDVANAVRESDETNNDHTEVGVCIN